MIKPKSKGWILALLGLMVSIAAATVVYSPRHQSEKPAVAARPLDQLTPDGALLYIEARDFYSLLKGWNDSPEKAFWLTSDNHSMFSQSRLFLRLERYVQHFGVAAGMPADTEFVTAAAGGESALAVYDVGKIQFVYITHLRHPDFLNSALWQSRNKFQPRLAGGATYFLGNDDESKQVMAFAVAGDYLVVTTREDLMVRTLELLNQQPVRSIRQDAWYSEAVASAPQTRGDLCMVLNMRKLAFEPHFRTYWVQQNITEMQSYTAAVSDLYREGNGYREERVILRKAGSTEKSSTSEPVADLLRMLPADYGFYQAQVTDSDKALDMLRRVILPPPGEAKDQQRQAPQVSLTQGEVGGESDLETRIDTSADHGPQSRAGSSALKKQVEQSGPTALLEVQATERASDGVLLAIPTLLVITAAHPWDASGLQQAIRSQLSAELSVSGIGFKWHQIDQDQTYFELGGLHPLYMAVRGKVLLMSSHAGMLTAAMRSSGAVSQVAGITYAAGFNHARERGGFYELAGTLDRTPEPKRWDDSASPQFFSRNLAGISRTLARLESETVVETEENDRLLQTVVYTWSH